MFQFPFPIPRALRPVSCRPRHGQILILTVLSLGATILGATTIAGLLMVYQIRQATDLANSSRAFYAADSGVEWALFKFFNPAAATPPSFSNGATTDPACFETATCEDTGTRVDCGIANSDTIVVRAVGHSADAARALGNCLRSTP